MPETPAPPTETAAETEGGWGWLDTAGLIAGCILIAIVADILTDGRLISRRLHSRPPQPAEQQETPGE